MSTTVTPFGTRADQARISECRFRIAESAISILRWRIRDPLQFYRTVRDEAGAQSRLDDVIYSIVCENLGRHTLREIRTWHERAL